MSVSPTDSVTRIVITGMHCPSCSSLIEEVLADVPGVVTASVSLEGAAASVTHESTVSPAELCAVVRDLGYEASTDGDAN